MTRPTTASLLAALLALAACGEAPAPVAQAEPAPVEESVPEPERFPPAAIEQAKADFLARDEVLDVMYQGHRFDVEWHIGILSTDPSFPLAFEICDDLRQRRLLDDEVEVRIINVEELELSGGDFRGSSLGLVDCSTGERRRT